MDDRLVGQNVEILCEGPSKTNEARLTGRTGSNCIVVFEGNRDRHLGEIFNVCVTVQWAQDQSQTPLCRFRFVLSVQARVILAVFSKRHAMPKRSESLQKALATATSPNAQASEGSKMRLLSLSLLPLLAG